MADSLGRIAREVARCRACPRLVAWREAAAASPPRRFRGQRYWARPVPGFGDRGARLLVVGLAPAAHGGNRTGRIFTGDASGDFLFAALHRAGFANQARSVARDDGLVLTGAYVAAAARCAPPDNKPTPAEFARCRPFLVREIAALRNLRVVLALGRARVAGLDRGAGLERGAAAAPLPPFAHGAETRIGEIRLLASYHVSQQNTFTGRLTPGMLDRVIRRTREIS